jgi:hypothetical protein
MLVIARVEKGLEAHAGVESIGDAVMGVCSDDVAGKLERLSDQ